LRHLRRETCKQAAPPCRNTFVRLAGERSTGKAVRRKALSMGWLRS